MPDRDHVLIRPCPHALIIVHADEVGQFFSWLDSQVIDYTRSKGGYARPEQVAAFVKQVDDMKAEVDALLR